MDDVSFSETSQREFEDVSSSDLSEQEKTDNDLYFENIQREIDDAVSSKKIRIQEKMDDLFSSKTDWILVEELPINQRPPLDYCKLCVEDISVPYYTTKEDDDDEESKRIFVHKVCIDLPKEMEHQLHPGHTLISLCQTTKEDSAQFCNSCNDERLSGYVYYKCSDCEEFVLGLTCALKLFPINHKCHQHPVIPIHKTEYFHCVACNMDQYGVSYECTVCPSFRVHQDCVSPRIVKLPYHRHGLELVYSPLPEDHHRIGEPIYCHNCRQDMKGQSCAFHCASCKYVFHIYGCRSIKHFTKYTPLVLVEEEGANTESASANCHGCRLKISVPYYVYYYNDRKTVFLHKLCGELPWSVEHPLHPGHELTLGKFKQICAACDAPWKGYSYSCPHDSCCFSIDIICALKNLFTFEFHKHPLISSHETGSLACRACNIDSDGPSYKCTICRFWVHQHCASAPMSRKQDSHPHVLKLIYSIQDSLPKNRKQFHCHVCREEIQPHNWAYRCAACKYYYIHVHDCSQPPWIRDIGEFDFKAALAAAVHLPVDESVTLASLFFMETEQKEDKEIEPEHQEANGTNSRQTLFLDPNETCSRCVELLAAPCNNCALCKDFLSKAPAEFNDPASQLYGYYSKIKDTKQNSCNGIGMRVVKHILTMSISSSVLPRYVKHEGHPHVLLTTFITEPTWCSACDSDVRGYAFRCNVCDFTIDTYCGLLPGSITHSYDKKHPFKLSYYSVEDVEEYVCELCEKDITTMWFYHCVECDHSIHPRCIWKYHIMFGPFMYLKVLCSEAILVPTSKTHPLKCISHQEEASGCRYSLFSFSDFGTMIIHLQCEDEKMERWCTEQDAFLDKPASFGGLDPGLVYRGRGC